MAGYLGLGLALLVPARQVHAQGLPVPPVATARPAVVDSTNPPARALPAFFRSLVLPGWGQATLDRKLTGGLFLLWEGVTLGMTVKTYREVQFLRETEDSRIAPGTTAESPRLRAKKAEHQDWLVLLVFNHLFSGLEAYVGAHLWDFPGDLKVRTLPGGSGGRTGVGVSVPLRLP